MLAAPTPTRCCCDVETSLARALDVAEHRGFDVYSWAECSRQLATDLAKYDEVVDHEGRVSPCARELERSIELGVEVLAGAFRRLASIVGEVERAP
jgi:acetolactate synthase regulatory subunit